MAVALLVVAPLLVLPLSFVAEPGALGQLSGDLLPESLRASLVLALGVGAGTLVLGAALALLVSFYDFPGRRWLDWALVLPLAMPGYVLVFVLLGQYDASSPLPGGAARRLRIRVPVARDPLHGRDDHGVVARALPLRLRAARAAFLGQSRDLIEAARSLGSSYARTILRGRADGAPALAAGVALAMMEALADFGTVNLLGYRAMTDAVYRVWYGAYDQAAALQLATVLVSLSLGLVVLERLLRGRARYLGALSAARLSCPSGSARWRERSRWRCRPCS